MFVQLRKGFDLKYVFLFHLFTSLIIPVYGMDQTISRARSRRLLTIISMNLHSPTSDCPEPFSSEPKADHLLQKNLSYLLPLNPNDEALLREVITPEILQNSYKRDIARAVSLAELTTSWLSTKGPMTFEGTTVTVDFKLFLEPMLRSFIQTVSYYSGNAEESGRMWGSLVQSVAICISSEPAIFVAKPQKNSQQPNSVAPSNLCTRTTEVLEGARLQPISSVNQMLGLWAPLHCNLGCTVAGRKIQLHLIFPIPHTKSLSLVFEFDLRNLTLDLCAAGLDYCRHSTTQCFYRQYRPWPFDVGNYICQCKPGFYTDRPENGYPAELLIQNQHKGGSDSEGCKIKGLDRMSCKVCPPDCPNCTSGTPCGVEYNMHLLRGIPLAIQTFSITTCLFLGILSFRVRRTRVFKAANWMFLEIFLLGAILLYSTTIVMYFRASSSTCILVPWFREVGFALMYGVLIVKLYRVLLCFQSRKAHRVHVRDKDLFKYLGCFIAIVAGYMFAWTAVSLDYTGLRNLVGFPMQTSSPGSAPVSQPGYDDILVKGRVRTVITPTPTFKSPSLVLASINSSVLPNTSVMSNRTLTTQMATPNVHYQYFRVCRAMSWDIVVQLGEIAILLVGVHYCRLIWSAPSDYNENRCITVALLAELVGSGILYLIRPFIWYSTHPDVIFLIYFVRCHLTVSVNIGVIFGLKFWYLHKPPSPQVGGMVVGVVGGRRGMVGAVPGASAAPHLVPCNNKLRLASNGELDLADVNLADMDPEVIRIANGYEPLPH
uniref:G_PROTEIN_RECEP_F3_4 domain-containing protein n=1 Tax=Mesocestoides corti TaxID=53468 RepID=A0A5K3ESU1_MESCO